MSETKKPIKLDIPAIRKLLEEKGITEAELIKNTKISYYTIFITGKYRSISEIAAQSIANFLDVNINEVIINKE